MLPNTVFTAISAVNGGGNTYRSGGNVCVTDAPELGPNIS